MWFDSMRGSQVLSFENILVRVMIRSLSEIGSCYPTEFFVIASVVHHSMECELQYMLKVSFRQQVHLRVGMHTLSPNCQ